MRQHIRDYRAKAGISQKQLGEAINVPRDQRAISSYETGVRTPNIRICVEIIRALNRRGANCTLDDVFPTGTDSEVEQV